MVSFLLQQLCTLQGARFVFTAELRDNGFGFLLPPEQIHPSGEEFWEAFKVQILH